MWAGLLSLSAAAAPAQTAELKRQHLLALQTLNALQKRSINENREYCGIIVRDDDGTLRVWRVVPGAEASCAVPRPPEDLNSVAAFHTHGSHSPRYDAEVPSTNDLRVEFRRDTYGYVSTPGGRVWFIDPNFRRATLFCGRGCVVSDPTYNPRHTEPIDTLYTLRTLTARQGR
ncbi:MAG: DUF4329 domain-containing protein [Pseudomonadota bacterium]